MVPLTKSLLDQIHLLSSSTNESVNPWLRTSLEPHVLAWLRNGSQGEHDDSRTSEDPYCFVVGSAVAAEMYTMGDETNPRAHHHPIATFFDVYMSAVDRENGHLGVLGGGAVYLDAMLPADLMLRVVVRNDTVSSISGVFIDPVVLPPRVEDAEPVITKIVSGTGAMATLDEVKSLPDPIFADCFDLHAIAAEASITAKIAKALIPNKQSSLFQSLHSAVWELVHNPLFPSNTLTLKFVELDHDQENLDARAAMFNPLTSLTIRQYANNGQPARYVTFTNLTPNSVKVKLDSTAKRDDLQYRTWSYTFESVKETKEYPSGW